MGWQQERLLWEADPNAWAAKVEGPVESEEDAITWREAIGATADTIGREQGSEARKKFLDIAHRPLPLDHFVEAYLSDSGLPERTRQERRTAVKRLAAWRPALRLETLSRKVAAEYVAEVLAKGNHMTGNKAISNLKLYWEAAHTAGLVVGRDIDNPWIKQRVKAPRNDPYQKERGFTVDEVRTLLFAPYPPTWDHRDRLHDAMRIAALSGMRIDEMCRLTVADCNDGLFNIRRGKTLAAERQVPIHSALTEIVERRRAGRGAGEYLFFDIEKEPGGGERSMPLSKQFTRYRRLLGVDVRAPGQRRSLVNFHSFRRWFVTAAERAHQPPHIFQAVIGHSRAGLALNVYSDGPSVEDQLRACVEAVKLPTE